MSIKKSLQSSILLMATIPVLLMAILAYIVVSSRYATINKKNAQTIARDYSMGLCSQLESQIIEASALSNNNYIKSLLLKKINTPDTLLSSDSKYFSSVTDTLTQASNSFNNHVNYYLYDIDGYFVTSSTNNSTLDWSEVMSEPIEDFDTVQIINLSPFTEETMDIITPVIVKDEIIGLIRSNLSIKYFDAFLSNINHNYIIDCDQNVLFGYDASSEEDQLLLKHLGPVLNDLKPTLSENAEPNILRTNTTFCESQKYIYGYITIPEYNWVYVVRKDTSSVVNVVSTLPIILIAILFVVIIFANQISQNLAVKYTEPILELCDKMHSATNGRLDVHCNIERDDEFGTLSNHFNRMMNIISTNYNEISNARKTLEANQLELKNNYQNIEEMAYTDALTGLYNRTAFFKYANEILNTKSTTLQSHAVIFIDLDGFKEINDTLGHDYGDLLLKAVSTQLATLVDTEDILSRNGGDEFVIFKKQFTSLETLETFLTDLVSIANHPFVIEDETMHITLSAGVALYPQNGLSLGELMKHADIAMYASKTTGKNSYTFFTSSMEDELNRRNDLIDILRNGIKTKDLYLVYQPQADTSTGKIIGCEALMRLNSPVLGFVSPDEFIPIAEECGLIDELGEWALIEAYDFNQKLIHAGFEPICVSVNVSTIQLRGTRLLEAIETLYKKANAPLTYLKIELTESVLMKNFEHNLAVINRMRELGVQIALDDFGTGYSSFSYLTKLPINTLKIDKSFINGICDNKTDTYILETIIKLAHQLNITVVAEGVETVGQLKILQEQVCDILQGYLFSKAIPEDEFIELLRINS